MTQLNIPGRYNGPAGSANGGWAAGRLAALLPATRAAAGAGGAAVVTLRRPPPLDRAMDVLPVEGGLELWAGAVLVAQAAPTVLGDAPLAPVSPAVADEAATRYAGLVDHPFPTCYVCGTDRPAEDGLHLRPGPVGDGRVATPWQASAELSHVLVWAALDCPGGWAVNLPGRPMVLGRMTARIDALPAAGERCVVVGGVHSRAGRKTFTATAAYGSGDQLLGQAVATWIAVDPQAVTAG